MESLLPLLIASLIIGSCVSAPITTPPPSSAPVDQDGENDLNFSDIEDVMMDPSAKMRKLAKVTLIILFTVLLKMHGL